MRLIDVDSFVEEKQNLNIIHETEYQEGYYYGYRDALKDLTEAPTVDAVPVIRCKNCGWYRPEDESCGFWPDEGYRDPEHFCGEGKPRE